MAVILVSNPHVDVDELSANGVKHVYFPELHEAEKRYESALEAHYEDRNDTELRTDADEAGQHLDDLRIALTREHNGMAPVILTEQNGE